MGGASRFTTKPPLMQRDSSFGDSRSMIFAEQLAVAKENPFDYRESYRKAIANGRKRAIHIKSKRRLQNGVVTSSSESSRVNGYTTTDTTLNTELSLDMLEGIPEATGTTPHRDTVLPRSSKLVSGKSSKKRKHRLRVKFNASTKGGSIVRPAQENQETQSKENNQKQNYLSPKHDNYGFTRSDEINASQSFDLNEKEQASDTIKSMGLTET